MSHIRKVMRTAVAAAAYTVWSLLLKPLAAGILTRILTHCRICLVRMLALEGDAYQR
jgi:hypothetical protein